MHNHSIEVFGQTIEPGQSHIIEFPISRMFGNAQVNMPVTVIHGKQTGPRLLLTAAIHGDELNGVEIIRRVIHSHWIKKLRGTLIAVPVVNALGLIHRSRYLPDRRDLNRCFPGSAHGSQAARIAHLLTNELMSKTDYVIDLHTGAIHRSNLPQLRVDMQNSKAEEIANAFGVPVIVDSVPPMNTLRATGNIMDVGIITYEAGEALRFEEGAITPGERGIRNVMMHLGMLPKLKRKSPPLESVIAKSTDWVRASADGFFRPKAHLGDRVHKGDCLAMISGPLDKEGVVLESPHEGIVIGRNNLPLVLEGEAVFHIATFHEIDQIERTLDDFTISLQSPFYHHGDEFIDS